MKPLSIKPILAATTAAVLLAGCEDTGGIYRWNAESGTQVDEGAFGNPTMNNILVMNGERDYVVALAHRFNDEVPDTINFAFDSAVLEPEAQAILRNQAQWIRQFPEVHFRVYGHTDLVGSAAYNQQLGLRRAQAAVTYLIAQGVNRSQLEAVASYGETRPLVNTASRERQNRRTVTEVNGFMGNNPMVLDGKYAEIIYREYVNSATAPSALGDAGTLESL